MPVCKSFSFADRLFFYFFLLFLDQLFFANPLSRAPLSLRPALRRSCYATLPIGGRLLSIK
ncbi:MAG TPA: hypothetical protein DCZ76_03080 [Treponema sp.]|nr:hypothetical protein [Treponema sp.]